MTEVRVVQILPNDHPPFADICTTYRLAFESLGVDVKTLVLAPARGEPLEGVVYLDLDDMRSVRNAGRAIRALIGKRNDHLALCHRYRAYRAFRASGVKVGTVVAVAHEFGFFKRRQRRIERALFAREVLFGGVSPAVQAELAGTVKAPLCLPNALDLSSFDAALLSREAAESALGVSPVTGLTLGLVGRLVEKKAPELALAALRCMVDAHENVRLLVIGDGPLREGLADLAENLPVVFCGFVPDARRLLRALDALLVTSREVEAFGMVALEAMSAGVPVVSGPMPGPQFVLGGNGYYYTRRDADDVAEAVRRVKEDAATGVLGARLANARERAEREFSVPALARRLDEMFFSGRR